jgi:hypothetical protein
MNSDEHRFKGAAGAAASLTVVVFFLSGCGSQKETIQFSDEHMATLEAREQTPARSPQTAEIKPLDKQDLFTARVAVYSFLLQRHFWDDGEYSAVFLQDDDIVEALAKKFPTHVPPIKSSEHAALVLNRTPVDKDTGKPAMILSVDVGEPNADDSVDAIGRWYAGGAVTGFYNFVLKKSGDGWAINIVK